MGGGGICPPPGCTGGGPCMSCYMKMLFWGIQNSASSAEDRFSWFRIFQVNLNGFEKKNVEKKNICSKMFKHWAHQLNDELHQGRNWDWKSGGDGVLSYAEAKYRIKKV